jgi:transposase
MMKKLRRIVSKLGIPWQDPLERLRILWVGIDISKRRHTACLGTQDQVFCRRLRFTNSRRGLERLEAAIRRVQSQSQATAVVIGMEPSGVYWKPLFAQLRLRGYQVVSVDAKAVKHNRKTLSGNGSKTDRKDAYCIYDLLRQGKFFLPVERAPHLESAYRLMRHYEDSRKRSGQIRNQLRALIGLAFPELNERFKKLHAKTALDFLLQNPTPESIRRLGREAFLERWRGPHGRWGRRFFVQLYELATRSIGIADPDGHLEGEIRLLAKEFEHALAIQEQWFQEALAVVQGCWEFQLLRTLPGIADKLAVGLLSSIGNPSDFQVGKQWVSLAGLDLRLCDSGESVHKVPKISRRGRVLLRSWLWQASIQVTRHEGPFRDVYERRQARSPGRGAKGRARIAVCDKLVRVIFAMLRDQRAYDPHYDRHVEDYYQALNQPKQLAA